MKIYSPIPKFFLPACAALISFNAFAQQKGVIYKPKDINVSKQKTNELTEAELRAKMKADGLLDPVIDKLIEERKVWVKQGKNIQWTNVTNKGSNPVPLAPCGDMGGENGWGSWLADVGTASSGPTQTWTPPAGPPAVPNFSITTGAGLDPNTPGPNPGDPPVPVVCPGFGGASIELGEPCMAGCVAEQLTYPLTVTPQDSNFVYAYAIVIEDAGHAASDQPFVNFSVYDQNGVLVPQCANFTYTGGPSIPGFYGVSGTGCGWQGTDQYKPWTIVGIDLSNYIGTTVTIVITNVDCAQCGHWAYSYWDFMCGTASLSAGCIGNTSTICGPIDPNIAYTYQWYQNSVPMPPPNGTSQCIVVTPSGTDTFTVEVQQPSGCNFHLGYVPASVFPDFNFTQQCGNFVFMDSSSSLPSTVNMTGWNWSFPGGNPSTANTQTVNVTYPTAGHYAVTLTVTCSAGCSAVMTHTIQVTALPTAAFTSSPPCLGGAVSLSDGSISPAGDPIAQWSWNMPGGFPSTAATTNTATSYTTSGVHTVTLTVTTAGGCSSSISQQVVVYTPPVASFTGNGTGCVPVCVNNYLSTSTSTDGNITGWNWSFPGGTPSSSSLQTPGQICYYTAGTYSATLIVTTQYGCSDTITNPAVTPQPWPNADFCISPAGPVSATDPVFTFCDLWSSDVVQWTWNFGDGDSNIVNTDPIHNYSATVTQNDFYTYQICLRVQNQYTCWDTICKTVEIIPEYEFYIPNTFTPNGDFMNEVFFGKGRGIKEYTIWIFDRWGNVIWDCTKSDKNTNWDNPGQDGLSSA